MTNQSNVIELNGSHYDALTGGPVNAQSPSVQAATATSPSPTGYAAGFQPDQSIYQPNQFDQTQQLLAQPSLYHHTTEPTAVASPQQPITAPTIVPAAPVSAVPVVVAAPAAPAVPIVPVTPTPAQAAEASASAAPSAPAVATKVARQAAQHASRHKPQATKTLMRHAVKAPAASHSHQTHSGVKAASSPTHHKPDVSVRTTIGATGLSHRPAANTHATAVSANRHQRAQAAIQSNMVERFRKEPLPREDATAQPAAPAQAAQTAPAEFDAPAPFSALEAAAAANASQQFDIAAPAQAPPAVAAINAKSEPRRWPSADRYLKHSADQAQNEDEIELEDIPEAAIPSLLNDNNAGDPTVSSVFQRPTYAPAAVAQPAEPASRFAKEPVKEDVFERALAAAEHQEQPALKQSKLQQPAKRAKKPRHLARWATSAAVLLLIAGTVAFLNRGSIQLHLASAKAGFTASAPGYKPSGFGMAKISYSPGTVATDYEYNDKTFTVIQKKSTWDSQALLENFVATSNEAYQGYESNGRTVYVYGTGRATWVKDGIWYQIHADNVLSNEQLVKIAASM